MVLDHFNKESLQILSELQGNPESLFLFLKTIIDVHSRGTLNFPVSRDSQSSDVSLRRIKESFNELGAYLDRVSDFARLLQHNPFSVDDKTAELYVEVSISWINFKENSHRTTFFPSLIAAYNIHCVKIQL